MGSRGGEVRRAAVRLAALAQDGLTCPVGDPTEDYDTARYREITGTAAGLLAAVSTRPLPELEETGHPVEA